MTDETRKTGRSDVPSPKRRWSTPRVETVEGRDAAATFRGSASIDYGIYS